MKMRNEIKAACSGVVARVNVKEGELVAKEHLLVELT